jgi:3-carboxy-cis,cis-muconate cycloisomerase
MGVDAREIRSIVASKLGLRDELIPWHASRDRFIDVTSQCANLSVTLVRLAREIVDLSRTEIDEVFEPGGHHKGASSTMPQKRNPVMSEAIIGIGLQAIGSANSMYRAGEIGHERAAGEWQLEWKALPETLMSTISALIIACETLEGLGVNQETMRANIEKQNGSIMAEAYMIELSRKTGREQAHDLLHQASKLSMKEDISLAESIVRTDPSIAQHYSKWPLDPADYIGNAQEVCKYVVGQWKASSPKR